MSTTLVVIEGGTLTGSPEQKSTTSGKKLTNFVVSGEQGFGANKTTVQYKATAWGDLSDTISSLPEGTRFTLYGRLNVRSYEWQGQQKSAMEIVAVAVDVWAGRAKPAQAQEADNSDIPF